MPSTNSTFIYIGNLAEIDTNETNLTNENPSAIFQTFVANDMTVTNVVQNDDDGDGIIQSDDQGQSPDTFSYDVGGGPVVSALDSAGRYNVSYVDQNGDTQTTTISAYQTQAGDVFLKFPPNLQIRSVTIESVAGDGFDGITYGTSSNSIVVCFAQGTFVDTPDGPRAVETLKAGDMLATLDRGAQPIRLVHMSHHTLDVTHDSSSPVLIRAGALGPARPARDLIVSAQHRVLVGGQGQLTARFAGEALAPAKALTGLPGIRQMRGKKNVAWVHFSFDRHEVVCANGCLAESLLLGQMVLRGLTPLQRLTARDTYGPQRGLDGEALNGPPARPCLSVGQVRRLLANPAKSPRRDLKSPAGARSKCCGTIGQGFVSPAASVPARGLGALPH